VPILPQAEYEEQVDAWKRQQEKERQRKEREYRKQQVTMLQQEEALSEEQRRRITLDRELGELREHITDDKYQELLQNQRKATPIEHIDNLNMLWEERQALKEEGWSDEKIDEYQGKVAKKWRGKLNSMTAPKTPEEFAMIVNSPEHREDLRRLNEEQGKRYGRNFAAGFVDKVPGFEDRASTYVQALKKGKDDGMYPQDFDDSVFDGGIYKMRNFEPEILMEDWQKKQQTQLLAQEFSQFEKIKQQLSQNFQRLDPFGRVQFRAMEQRYNLHYNKYVQGRYNTLQYLRKQAQLAEGYKAINWSYHMKAPGGAPGDVISPENNGIFYQRQKDGSLKIHRLSPEYVEQNTKEIAPGLWERPTIKNDQEVMERIEIPEKPGPDWRERQDYLDRVEKLEAEYRKKATEEFDKGNPKFKDMEDVETWARQMAFKVAGEYKDFADQAADPDRENPSADPDQFLRLEQQAKRQISFEEGRLYAKQRAMKEWRDLRQARLLREEALAGPIATAKTREKNFKELQEERFTRERAEELKQATEEHEMAMEQWRQEPENVAFEQWINDNMFVPPDQRSPRPAPASPPPPMPNIPKKKPQSPDKAYGAEIDDIVKEVDAHAGDGTGEFAHALHMLGERDKEFKFLLDNPIPLPLGNLRTLVKEGKLKDGYCYRKQNRLGQLAKFFKHKGRMYQLTDWEGVPIGADKGDLTESVQQRVRQKQTPDGGGPVSDVSNVSGGGTAAGTAAMGGFRPGTTQQAGTELQDEGKKSAFDKAWERHHGFGMI
jgi:hypothetical protein